MSAPGLLPGRAQDVLLRDGLMVALTVVTGATDAIAFTRLGSVFTSVMTGNMVLLGMAIGRGALTSAGRTGLAVLSFVVGTVLGARVAGPPASEDPLWPQAVTVALCVEYLLFVVVAVAWWCAGSHPHGPLENVLLGASAMALGLQSSAILRFGVPGLSTTYLTGTLTTFVHGITTTRRVRGSGRSGCLLLALIAGAALGALLATRAPVGAPLVSLVVVGGVLVTARVRLAGRTRFDPQAVTSEVAQRSAATA